MPCCCILLGTASCASLNSRIRAVRYKVGITFSKLFASLGALSLVLACGFQGFQRSAHYLAEGASEHFARKSLRQ